MFIIIYNRKKESIPTPLLTTNLPLHTTEEESSFPVLQGFERFEYYKEK